MRYGKTVAKEKRKYDSMRIPTKLFEKVEEAIRELDLGYRDPTSFVLYAIWSIYAVYATLSS